ncbi:heme/hemin ABC transporter substrate-binding protein [Rhizobium oryzicola]|uniref:heme/hemin ABC transporter substrate-binding protein n=1 Tax=Rhizobium oryzicola TaxID=1232668 RepID=UPI003F532190
MFSVQRRRLGHCVLAAFALFIAFRPDTTFAAESRYPDAKRIVSVGGTVTEILYALGAESRIVAVDATSIHPAAARQKTDVGYMRALSPEGIIAQNPDLILLQEGSGPPNALAVLQASGIPMITIRSEPRGEAIAEKIEAIGRAVGLETAAQTLAAQNRTALKAVQDENAKLSGPPKRVLFILSLANGRVIAGGRNTEAAALIELAGGVNAAQEISGYKPLTDEAVIAAKPDFVLSMDGGNHLLTADQVFSVPALQSSPAAQTRAFLQMDGLLVTGFGPRTPDAARALRKQLYPGSP